MKILSKNTDLIDGDITPNEARRLSLGFSPTSSGYTSRTVSSSATETKTSYTLSYTNSKASYIIPYGYKLTFDTNVNLTPGTISNGSAFEPSRTVVDRCVYICANYTFREGNIDYMFKEEGNWGHIDLGAGFVEDRMADLVHQKYSLKIYNYWTGLTQDITDMNRGSFSLWMPYKSRVILQIDRGSDSFGYPYSIYDVNNSQEYTDTSKKFDYYLDWVNSADTSAKQPKFAFYQDTWDRYYEKQY